MFLTKIALLRQSLQRESKHWISQRASRQSRSEVLLSQWIQNKFKMRLISVTLMIQKKFQKPSQSPWWISNGSRVSQRGKMLMVSCTYAKKLEKQQASLSSLQALLNTSCLSIGTNTTENCFGSSSCHIWLAYSLRKFTCTKWLQERNQVTKI